MWSTVIDVILSVALIISFVINCLTIGKTLRVVEKRQAKKESRSNSGTGYGKVNESKDM